MPKTTGAKNICATSHREKYPNNTASLRICRELMADIQRSSADVYRSF
jgi:hypothetical protein